jgi:large subunit ribosomal protein L31
MYDVKKSSKSLEVLEIRLIFAVRFFENLKIIEMKNGIHPENYRLVAFKDMSNGTVFLTKSTVNTKESEVIDGVEYPLFKLEISNTSHPFYTGKMKLVDTAGRVDKFRNRYQKHMEQRGKKADKE